MSRVDDNLALLVGRVILAFGNLDQQIHHSIRMLQNAKIVQGISAPPEEIDDRFKHRLAHLRRLLTELSGNDAAFLSRYDRLQTKIKRAEQMRGNLAHGLMLPLHDRISVYTAKEYEINGKFEDYPRTECEALPDLMFELAAELYRFKTEAQTLLMKRGSAGTST